MCLVSVSSRNTSRSSTYRLAADHGRPGGILFLISWQEDGRWLLLRQLREDRECVAVLQPWGQQGKLPGPVKRLLSRFHFLYLPVAALIRGRRHSVVASWNLMVGVVYGLLNRLAKLFFTTPKHIIRDFHVDLSRLSEPLYRLKIELIRLAMPGIDGLLVTSGEEEKIYAELFSFPRDRIRFLPDAPPEAYLEVPHRPDAEYVFAFGNSERDFDTLARAMEGLPVPCTILSQAYQPTSSLPANVTLVTRRVPEDELILFISASRMTIVPTHSYRVAAGQNCMLQAMALERPVIVTANMATVEYAKNGDAAFFVQAGDVAGLRQAILELWQDRERAGDMGKKAKMAAMGLPHAQACAFYRYLREFLPTFLPPGQ